MNDPKGINVVRIMEFQRLLAGVMAAKWEVIHFSSAEELLTNDIGYAVYERAESSDKAVLIPIGRREALAIAPTRKRKLVYFGRSGTWHPIIEHFYEGTDWAKWANSIFAREGTQFLIGSEKVIRWQRIPLGALRPCVM